MSTANGGLTTVESKFQAALNVIKNLPKNGSYKPTPQMMLKFYSYFKQATEGPCRKPKPWAWDVINKAKWEAWSKLGDMPKEKAMEEYVENLKLVMTEAPPVSDEQIVEAMPATDNVQAFIKVLGNFYEIVDLEPPSQFRKFSHGTTSTPLKNGIMLEKTESDGSPLDTSDDSSEGEQDNSNQDALMNNKPLINEPVSQISEDHATESEEESEDEFCDTAEDIRVLPSAMHSYTLIDSDGKAEECDPSLPQSMHVRRTEADSFAQHDSNTLSSIPTVTIQSFGGEHGVKGSYKVKKASKYKDANQGTNNGQASGTPYTFFSHHTQSGAGGGEDNPPRSHVQVKNQIATTLAQLQQDMDRVMNRLSMLEALTVQQEGHRTSINNRGRHWLSRVWPFTELSPKTVFFILSWPFAVVWFLNTIHRRRLKR